MRTHRRLWPCNCLDTSFGHFLIFLALRLSLGRVRKFFKLCHKKLPRKKAHVEHIPGRVRTSCVIPRQTHVEPVSGRRQVVLRVSAKGARAWEGVGEGITACGIFLACIIKAILLLPFLAI